MSGDIDAAASIATGSLLAHAVDPPMRHVGDHAAALCLNCGTRLVGAHCHACGQSGHVHRSIGAIGHDIAHGVFHFEGRIWRTLPMLVFHPGTLTRRYVGGERTRFVSPLALFLYTVFLMFALYSWVGPKDVAERLADASSPRTAIAFGRDQASARLAELERDRAKALATRAPVAEIDTRIAKIRGDLTDLAQADREIARKTATREAIDTGWPWLDHGIAKARGNPGLVAYKVQSSAYKFSWALILLSVPFVTLLFLWRRRFGLYDHAIFVTYSIAFVSLLVIALELGLLAGIATGVLWKVALVVSPVHMFAQLRGAYSLSRFSALWRTAFLLSFAGVVLLTFVLGLVAMGVSG